MASGLRMTPAPEPQTTDPGIASPFKFPAHAYLARLAALHDEAAETAHLANLLGRAPWAVGALGTAALATAVLSPPAESVSSLVWLALVAIALIAIGHAYGRAMEAPFDRPALKNFARSLASALLFAGTTWGAGLSLTLPAHPTLAGALAFVAGISLVLTSLLRARSLALYFLAPATMMGMLCTLMNGASAIVTFGILASGISVAAGAGLFERSGSLALHAQAR